eukprot:4136754-Amphidinium_carterae.1
MEQEAMNLLKALHKMGHDWDHTKRTISRCRSAMRDYTAALVPAWKELSGLVPKGRVKQRQAWE